MGTVEETLNIARSQIGYTESPAGSNKTKYGVWFGLNGQPWCAIFQCWVLDQANVPIIKQAYTPALAQWFKNQNRWSTTPHPGDLVFFDFPGGHTRIEHVGMVESVSNSSIQTIEGNTAVGNDSNGGAVMRRTRTRNSTIIGYGRPAYSSVPTPPPNPTVGVTKKVAEDMTVNETEVNYSLDGNGNGWFEIAIPHEKVVSVKFNGPNPPVNGYPNLPIWASQDHDGHALITLTEGTPNFQSVLWVYSRP